MQKIKFTKDRHNAKINEKPNKKKKLIICIIQKKFRIQKPYKNRLKTTQLC